MLNATFNNISVISWWSVLLVEEILVLGENHLPAANHLTSLSHNMLYRIEYTATGVGFELATLVVIGSDCIGSCKSNFHTIAITMVRLPLIQRLLCDNIYQNISLQTIKKPCEKAFIRIFMTSQVKLTGSLSISSQVKLKRFLSITSQVKLAKS